MEPNAWKGFFRSYVLGQWYCYIFNMILKNNNQDLNWYWNALWLSSHSFWKLRNCIQASKWKKSWVGVQVFACDVAVESDHVVIRNSRSQFKTTSSSRKSEGDFIPCGQRLHATCYEDSPHAYKDMPCVCHVLYFQRGSCFVFSCLSWIIFWHLVKSYWVCTCIVLRRSKHLL